MRPSKAVSLSDELHTIVRALDGLCDDAERLQEMIELDRHRPLAIASMLVIIRDRLRLVERMVRGSLDPWLLQSSRENTADDDGQRQPLEDIVLRNWSDKKTLRHLREQVRMAKRRVKASR